MHNFAAQSPLDADKATCANKRDADIAELAKNYTKLDSDKKQCAVKVTTLEKTNTELMAQLAKCPAAPTDTIPFISHEKN